MGAMFTADKSAVWQLPSTCSSSYTFSCGWVREDARSTSSDTLPLTTSLKDTSSRLPLLRVDVTDEERDLGLGTSTFYASKRQVDWTETVSVGGAAFVLDVRTAMVHYVSNLTVHIFLLRSSTMYGFSLQLQLPSSLCMHPKSGYLMGLPQGEPRASFATKRGNSILDW